ncbi:MAG: peptidoglycan DD-metalloendopeptidase family protein [Clostridia bacterium]|nr:peptidoglycan DD-metalloendopeptidase family protein [Clostridia bacterium]
MKRSIALFLSLTLLLLCAFSSFRTAPAQAATMQDLEDEVDRLEQEIKENQKKLGDLADRKEAQQEYLQTLEAQIAAVEKKADALNQQIKAIDEEIAKYDNQLKQLKNEIALLDEEVKLAQTQIKQIKQNIRDSREELSRKLKASYMTGNQSALKLLMGSDTLASFLTHLEMMKRMSENDRKVINGFRDQVRQLNLTKEQLNKKQEVLEEKHAAVTATKQLSIDKKNELNAKKMEYQATTDQLEKDYAAIATFIDKIDKTSAAYEDYIKQLEAERAQADRELDELILAHMTTEMPTTTTVPTTAPPTTTTAPSTAADIGNGDPSDSTTGDVGNGDPSDTAPSTTEQPTSAAPYVSGESWAWPLGNYPCYISSGFGYRDASIGGNAFHGGTDIAGSGIYGQPVYASRSGTVIGAIWGTTGYGRYVVIDHGDGFTTIYGHCSNLTVTEGQHVEKGYQIANVGSTGNSTGPHLHFEVRYNNVKQNPMNYVTKP